MAKFDHEKLNVYQKAIRFVAWADDLLQTIPKSTAVHNQLDRASTSVPLNIAEGNGSIRRPTDVASLTLLVGRHWNVRLVSMCW